MKIIFMLAAKTYMYLPLFLAKEKGIFKSVFEAKRIKDDIEFRICDGDRKSTRLNSSHVT